MFNPHAQGIRHSRTFERDGPHVAGLDKAAIIAPRKIWQGQCETGESKKLDGDNKIIFARDVLNSSERISYIQESSAQEKPPATIGGEHNKLEYTRNGKPYEFSPYPHKTVSFMPHIERMGRRILEKIQEIECTEHDLMDSATEYEYGIGRVDGGTIEKKNDSAGAWRHVAFYAVGQTRYLRITKDGARGYINVPLHDNTLVICTGSTFNKNYFHQVDSLPADHHTGTSLLLKCRFRKPLLSGTKTI